MPKLRSLTSKQLTKILIHLGFQKISQRGSHVKFLRLSNNKQILVIPNHKQLATGTLKEIFNQLCTFIPKEDLFDLFYN